MIAETVQYYAVGALLGALFYLIGHNDFFVALNRRSAVSVALEPLVKLARLRDSVGRAALILLALSLIAGLSGGGEGAESAWLLGMAALGANMGLCGAFDPLFPASMRVRLRR